MSYFKRTRNKKCATFILRRLYAIAPLPYFWIKEEHWYHKLASLRVEELERSTDKYSREELNRAMGVLCSNKHISLTGVGHPAMKENEKEDPTIILTIEGQIALQDNFYETLIRKDLLETMELNTKWIIPILSLIIALMAYFKK
jgi:hypothetical protein